MTKDEALKMAIDDLELCNGAQAVEEIIIYTHDAIKACKEALEQPAQEPVAWNEEEFNAIAYAYRSCPAHEIEMISERYQDLVDYVLSITHPAPSWQGLSDDEIDSVWFEVVKENNFEGTGKYFARAIEQALKEKNT